MGTRARDPGLFAILIYAVFTRMLAAVFVVVVFTLCIGFPRALLKTRTKPILQVLLSCGVPIFLRQSFERVLRMNHTMKQHERTIYSAALVEIVGKRILYSCESHSTFVVAAASQ